MNAPLSYPAKLSAAAEQYDRMAAISREAALKELRSSLATILDGINRELREIMLEDAAPLFAGIYTKGGL